MKCKNCNFFQKIGNTESTGQGLCTFFDGFSPTTKESECVFSAKPYTCKDCDRFGNDDACMTAREDDPVYDEKGHACPGFIDKDLATLVDILCKWEIRGVDLEEKLAEALEEARAFKEKIDERS